MKLAGCFFILFSAIFFNSFAVAQPANRFKACQDFLSQAKYSPALASILPAFSLDQDAGIVVHPAVIKSLNLRDYPGERAHRLESIPTSGGPLKGIKEGLQINDLGGEPRRFEMVEDFTENYAENFLPGSKLAKAKPIVVHIYRYKFEFDDGACKPIQVTQMDGQGEKTLYGADFKNEMSHSTTSDSETTK